MRLQPNTNRTQPLLALYRPLIDWTTTGEVLRPKDKIAQAVRDGKITQEQADWLLQGIDKGWALKGRGFGLDGRGRRGMKRRPGHLCGESNAQPARSMPARGTSG